MHNDAAVSKEDKDSQQVAGSKTSVACVTVQHLMMTCQQVTTLHHLKLWRYKYDISDVTALNRSRK